LHVKPNDDPEKRNEEYAKLKEEDGEVYHACFMLAGDNIVL
jgi:hypothetical protein